MTSGEALDRLRSLLNEAGIDPDHPTAANVQQTWKVMREFGAEPVEDAAAENDAILAQYGVYKWGDGEFFDLDITRQFSFDDEDGEYSHMCHLQCTFRFEPSERLRALGADNMWSFGLPLAEFFDKALAMDGFAGVRELGIAPLQLVIDYSDV